MTTWTLHDDRPAFRLLVEQVHDRSGYRPDVLEKDYYVTLLLQELAVLQGKGLKAYFKGGTALYKALHGTRRFSEDIDLSVDATGVSHSQEKTLLRNATRRYASLPQKLDGLKISPSSSTVCYEYAPEMDFDKKDALQRFGQVKIEATSFTIARPFRMMSVAPLLYESANSSQKGILETNYAVLPFEVLTMTVERIFVDKLFAAETYFRNLDKSNCAFDAAKHVYDLCVLLDEARILALLADPDALNELTGIRMLEESRRQDGIPGIPIADFTFFHRAMESRRFVEAYDTMQTQYVFRRDDRIEPSQASNQLNRLAELLGMT